MSMYPSIVPTFINHVDEVDVVAAADVNVLGTEVIALGQYVGTNPQGIKNSFADRVNVLLNSSGVLNNSNGFPADTTPVRLFYRSDAETLYIRKFDNSAWQAIGGAPTNTVFSWAGSDGGNGVYGIYFGSNATPTVGGILENETANLFYITQNLTNGSFQQMIYTKFNKVAGISTLKMYARIWARTTASQIALAKLDVNNGAIIGTTGVTVATNPTWVNTGIIDVSGLANGTVYDMGIFLGQNDTNGTQVYLSSVMVFGA